MPMPEFITRQRYKVVVLGAPASGKTALVRRLADGSFVEGVRQRGLDFYTCHITLRDDVAVALQLWDLSDCPCRPDDDHAPLVAYLFNSQAVLFVYDVSCPSSLEALRYALLAVESAGTAAGGTRPYMALVATKCDLQWAASEALACELAARHGCVRFTLSARSGQGVARAAAQLACDLAGVPVSAATEHSARFLDEPAGFPTLPSTPYQAAAGTDPPYSPVTAAADTVIMERHAPTGIFRARAPAYAAAAKMDPLLKASGRSTLHSIGEGGADCQPWQPVSRTTTRSQAATLISRTGPLGQRMRSDRAAPTPSVKGELLVSAQGASLLPQGPALDMAQALPLADAAQLDCGSPSGSLRRRPQRSWRTMLCSCLPSGPSGR